MFGHFRTRFLRMLPVLPAYQRTDSAGITSKEVPGRPNPDTGEHYADEQGGCH